MKAKGNRTTSMDFSPGAQPIANHKRGIEKVGGCTFHPATKTAGFKSPALLPGKYKLPRDRDLQPHPVSPPAEAIPDAEDADEKPLGMQRCFSGGGGGREGRE